MASQPNYVYRSNPGLLIIILDQSSSMSKRWDNGLTCADKAAELVNTAINEILLLLFRGSTIKECLNIVIIGCCQSEPVILCSAGVSSFYSHPLRVEKKIKKLYDGVNHWITVNCDYPVYVEPASYGENCLFRGFQCAYGYLKEWMSRPVDEATISTPAIVCISSGSDSHVKELVKSYNLIRELPWFNHTPLVFNVILTEGARLKGEYYIGKRIDGLSDSFDSPLNDSETILFSLSSAFPVGSVVYDAKTSNWLKTDFITKGFITDPNNIADVINTTFILDEDVLIDLN